MNDCKYISFKCVFDNILKACEKGATSWDLQKVVPHDTEAQFKRQFLNAQTQLWYDNETCKYYTIRDATARTLQERLRQEQEKVRDLQRRLRILSETAAEAAANHH